MKLEIGQKVWLIRFPLRQSDTAWIVETSIKAIGRKWFTVDGEPRHSFCVATGNQKPTEFMAACRVYFDMAVYEKEISNAKKRQLLKSLTHRMDQWHIETVEKVLEIIKPNGFTV